MPKKLYSIAFLILFLMNMSGYYAVLLFAEQQATRETAEKIEQKINEITGDLIIKMPMKLPYPPGSNDYEKISGQAEFDGELYHFLKQRFLNDTLYIVCVKDYKAKEIRDAIGNCVKIFTDQPAQSSTGLKIISTLVKDFLPVRCSIQQHHNGWMLSLHPGKQKQNFYCFMPLSSIFHPPLVV